jgi:hypothetical protein
MPNFDGIGPMGQGAMTGRRRGRCIDTKEAQSNETNQTLENNNIVYGLGRGGRPRGGGFGNRFGGGYGKGQGRGRGRGLGNR